MTDTEPAIIAIAAITEENRGIGIEGEGMPWDIPADLKRFKKLTSGHPVIMGKNTWKSLPHKPLPDRENIVLSRTDGFNPEGALKCNSLKEALAYAREKDGEKIFIMGGAEVYAEALPHVDQLELTIIHKHYGCDIFFPEFQEAFQEVDREEHLENDPPFAFCTFERE